QDTTSTAVITSNLSEAAGSLSDSACLPPVVIEHFLLYEFFRAPGIRHNPDEDPQFEQQQQQQQQPISHVSEEEKTTNPEEPGSEKEEDEHDASQCSPSTGLGGITQKKIVVTDKEWAGCPYMNTKLYG
ncbi:unnamed protein product, partial [Rotaria sp. Silwood1]